MGVQEDPTAPLAYRPERVEELRQMSRRALDDLGSIRRDDPTAVEAVRMSPHRAARSDTRRSRVDAAPRPNPRQCGADCADRLEGGEGDGRSWFDDVVDRLKGAGIVCMPSGGLTTWSEQRLGANCPSHLDGPCEI